MLSPLLQTRIDEASKEWRHFNPPQPLEVMHPGVWTKKECWCNFWITKAHL